MEEQARDLGFHFIFLEHDLEDCRTISRRDMRNTVNKYMTVVLNEKPLDATPGGLRRQPGLVRREAHAFHRKTAEKLLLAALLLFAGTFAVYMLNLENKLIYNVVYPSSRTTITPSSATAASRVRKRA